MFKNVLNSIITFFKKNSFIFGIILSTVIPVIIFGILYYSSVLINNHYGKEFVTKTYINKLELLSLCLNFIILRFYMKHPDYERTGKGVMIPTLIFALAYFYFTLKS